MIKQTSVVLVLLLIAMGVRAQVPVTTGSYVQSFGTADVAAWVDNSTYPGWYHNQPVLAGHVNVTSATLVNTGGFYTYECNGLNDQKIGSRASGSASQVRYGVVLRNQTGMSILSLRLRYRGYQLSLAQNGNVVNRIAFDYVVSPSLPGITSAATAALPALNFTQVQNSPVAGSSQINGYPCTQSTLINGCIALATPLANGSYILLRWTDVDDANNDHHLAIDDVQVDFDLTGTGCALLLPVRLVQFDAVPERDRVRVEWTTASEHDSHHFVVERSADGVIFGPIAEVPSVGNSGIPVTYTNYDAGPLPNISYYRLRQVDNAGTWSLSSTVAVQLGGHEQLLIAAPSVTSDGRVTLNADTALVGAQFQVLDAAGQQITKGRLLGPHTVLDLGASGAGCYVLRAQHGATVATTRVIVLAQ